MISLPERARAVADAVLYEGYMLYPYRASALKNRGRTTLGVLAPGSEPIGCDFILTAATGLQGELRFLHAPPSSERMSEQNVRLAVALGLGRNVLDFDVGGIRGAVVLDVTALDGGAAKVALTVTNASPDGDAEEGTMLSTQVMLAALGASFATAREHPAELAQAAARCGNRGLWPILLGERRTGNVLLCAPMVLDDYPQVAEETAGDLFDASEIDELLTLRVRTLAPAERDEIDAGDPRVRDVVARAAGLGDGALARLHGAIRHRTAVRAGEAGARLAAGDRVRLRPRGRSDVFDLVLAGRVGRVVSIEEDMEGRAYVAVTVDDDPGQDLGIEGRVGHRFFFAPDEVERVEP